MKKYLAVAVAAVGLFALSPIPDVVRRSLADHFDKRPVRPMLFIGNSRMYYHDMPGMVRGLADSAQATERFQITMRAWGGAALKDNWDDDQTQRLLNGGWHDVVLQAESRAHGSEDTRSSFFTFANKFIGRIEKNGVAPTFIVNWVYDDSLFDPGDRAARSQLYDRIQSDYDNLTVYGVHLANVGSAWEYVRGTASDIPLYEDGNHPTQQGSFISALVVYAALTGADVAATTFVPYGMDPTQGARIRQAVARWAQDRGMRISTIR